MNNVRPRAYTVGPYTVREDAGAPAGTDGQRIARVFSRSVAIFHGTLADALTFAEKKFDDCALTVRCTLCGSQPGERCVDTTFVRTVKAVPHVARADAYMRFLAAEYVREIEDRVYQDALDRREEFRDEPIHPEDRLESEA